MSFAYLQSLICVSRVCLIRKKRTNDLYAVKILRKSDMIQKNQVGHVKAERNILASTQNPFVIKMYYAFQSKEYLYLVMEYASGGDCFSLLQKFGILDESVAKYYIAQTVLALEYCKSYINMLLFIHYSAFTRNST